MHDPGPEVGGGGGGNSAGGGDGKMSEVRAITRASADIVDRRTLCLSGSPGETIHRGDTTFDSSVRELYGVNESTAAEQLIVLKSQLMRLKGDEFWSTFTKELAHILGAQYTLVSKRVLPHDTQTALEMPKFGEPGSCFSAVSMYFTNGEREEHTKGFEYPVQGSLCAHMQHDKVFLVPTHLADFIQDLSANFEVPVESHFAIPLRDDDGRCFAHVGVFWSVEGEKARKLSWGFIEMMLHALEDVLSRRLLAAPASEKEDSRRLSRPPIVSVSSEPVPSLKPFARSLSHELRTPMHGVVGMLDLMHLTVQESLEAPANEEVAKLLRTLKGNIETIQDSSRRAVEAADNLSHAYDFDMQVPEANEGNGETTAAVVEAETVAAKGTAALEPGVERPKRRRSVSLDTVVTQPSPKHRFIEMPPRSATPNMATLTPHTATLKTIVRDVSQITEPMLALPNGLSNSEPELPLPTPGTKFTRIRDILRVVVNESLRFGGRPDSAIATETEFGEHIEVRNRGSDGHASTKIVIWNVEPSVPDEILIDERDFAKLVSVLFLNALKFTEQGSVGIHVSLSPRSRFVVISVTDTGSGIPAAFRPYLFQAFARGDDSLTRNTEGLGLGLMVAKSLARRVGGDLVCVRSDTRGPHQGSEFELRIPLAPMESNSRSHTPSRTPTPVRYERSVTPKLSDEPQREQPSANGHDSTSEHSPLSSPQLPDQPVSPKRGLPPTRLAAPTIHEPGPPDTAGAPRRLSQSLGQSHDRTLGQKYPLNVLVAEDNKINRKLLVNMLSKLGYTQVHEAFDGAEAVRLMEMDQVKPQDRQIDVILMDLWMPHMDGYEAARRILAMHRSRCAGGSLRILAVTADVTDAALDRARAVGMHGIMTKPYKMMDLERLIMEFGPPAKVGA